MPSTSWSDRTEFFVCLTALRGGDCKHACMWLRRQTENLTVPLHGTTSKSMHANRYARPPRMHPTPQHACGVAPHPCMHATHQQACVAAQCTRARAASQDSVVPLLATCQWRAPPLISTTRAHGLAFSSVAIPRCRFVQLT
jgi:hypothetical protein